jgi:F0F1-type ATP synthase membrane subunit c/vacuolar-type H+-ATPase subunit K
MLAEFERQRLETDLIHRESRVTMIISLSMLASIAVYALVAYLHRGSWQASRAVRDAWNVLNVVSIVLIIIVLAVRRTIYFSPRLVRDDFTLGALLQRWRTIDIVLLSFAEAIAIFGLVISLLGMPFSRTFHFFVSGFLLTMISMPISFKVRDKIRTFEKYAGKSIW